MKKIDKLEEQLEEARFEITRLKRIAYDLGTKLAEHDPAFKELMKRANDRAKS